MAQTVAVVRNTLTATLSGTTDFTSTGFGTPDAAIIIYCDANSGANPQTGASYGVGFWDGTSQRAVVATSADNLGTSSETRGSDDSYGVVTGAASPFTSAFTVSSITDGIRLTMSVDNTASQRFCTVILLKGISAKALTFTPNSTQNATATSASLGFAPKLIFFTTIGATTADAGTVESVLSFGFAANDGTHRMIAQGHQGSQNFTNNTLLYSETRCVSQTFNGATAWSGEVTTWGADTFTMTTRDGGSGSDVCFALALGGADFSFDCGTLTTPASTGNDSVSTDVEPDALLLMLSTCTGTTIHTDGNAEGICIGMTDGTNQYYHNTTTGDNLDTSNAQSMAGTDKVINLDEENSGFSALADATISSFNSNNFTLNYSAVPGTARKGWWVVFGAVPASTGAGPILQGRAMTPGRIFGGSVLC